MTTSLTFLERHPLIEYGVLGNTYVYANEQEVEEEYTDMNPDGNDEKKTRTVYKYDVVDIDKRFKTEDEVIAELKKLKNDEITKYDTSSNVNVFSLNGVDVWLDRDTRVSLMNSTTIAKNMGQENTTLWLGTIKITVKCDQAIQLLSALEMYALSCFNKTAEHRNNVEALSTINEIVSYDYTVGYPEKLNLVTE